MSLKRVLLFIVPSLILAVAIFLAFQFFFLKSGGKGALQVTASPDSEVYLNGKLIGSTPLCKCEGTNMLETGDYTLRLVPKDNNLLPYEEKIVINRALLTVVDRKFGSQATSEGSIITLTELSDKNKTEILVLSLPEGADVLLDNESVGVTPLTLPDVTPSKHELKLRKDGYREKSIPILTTAGYKLQATIYLGIDDSIQVSPTPTPIATASGTLTPSPRVSPSATPRVSQSPTPKTSVTPTRGAASGGQKVRILDTPNGFLRVRASNSTASEEITRVDSGDVLTYLGEEDGWYQVRLSGGQTGWVSAQYAALE